MKTSQRVIYAGRVQGVGFRYSVKQIAQGYEVTGWVRNLADGTVEMLAEGEPTEVEAFAAAVATSHLARNIAEIRPQEATVNERSCAGFEIRH